MKHTTREQLKRILEGSVETQRDSGGARLHDDHDGTRKGRLVCTTGPDGDAWIAVHDAPPMSQSLRFRNYFGGGMSLRVHNALVILAHAIELDNKERPL